MKIRIILLVLLIYAVSVYAETNRVLILNVHYDNGVLKIKDKIIKDGFYPDRKLKPINEYTAEIISIGEERLYSTDFEVPIKVYTDSFENGRVRGGIIILNETDFALVLPYFDDAKYINIYDKQGTKLIETNVAPSLGYRKFFVPIVATAIALIIILLIIALIIHRERKEKE